MSKNMNLQGINPFRIALSNNVCSSKLNALKIQSSVGFIRTLAEVSPNADSVYEKLKMKKIKRPKTCATYKAILQYGCNESDLNKDLSNEEVFDLFMNFGSFSGKKEIYISFYYYNKLLVKFYNIMIQRLKNNFTKLASEHEISMEAQSNYWDECEKDLRNTLEFMNCESQERIDSYIDKCRSKSKLRFQLFIIFYRIFWNKYMENIEAKWNKKFYNELKNLKYE
ncbi:RAD protein (Pv-fam-e) [Plasmodium ovale wallikeri]|uniref:RAD protein (Pv-fam-e) n=1 Tax=Plasmodium ovale wallikeri TaxID=864142 RepID=A0A1A9AME7_PLAOA|nr:RAD protein (Pv-fam-e) [Plasmodium ovale wallikeri]SBT58287.1 RAD protein (Pv-fam-e) [Plasmodium ovale wallikeri]